MCTHGVQNKTVHTLHNMQVVTAAVICFSLLPLWWKPSILMDKVGVRSG